MAVYSVNRYDRISKLRIAIMPTKTNEFQLTNLLGVCISIFTIIAFITLFIFYFWHKIWFEMIGLPFDSTLLKPEFAVISIVNIVYAQFFLLVAIIGISSAYLSLRGLLTEKYFQASCEKLATIGWFHWVYLILMYFLFVTPLLRPVGAWFFILLLLFLLITPSVVLYKHLDKLFAKIRKTDNDAIYTKGDIIAFLLFIFIVYFFDIFYNSLLYIFLFLIFFFCTVAPSIFSTKPSPILSIFLGLVFMIVFPIAILMDDVRTDVGAIKAHILNNEDYKSRSVLPLSGLLSSASLQRGSIFIENIEQAMPFGLGSISPVEEKQKVLKVRYYVSVGEKTIVFITDNKNINALLLKDGKFLMALENVFHEVKLGYNHKQEV